ncbi:hypothetical protein DHEL01_v203649 [Diaporthe helianthi]|uniref:Uncharacterized protein n=1 Tax=Diaporthe helianthi TaxID=158607 RepID=A0A2P5I631_DIAHE|nr:hypothetical protein DHEL01_v203649 [Diaporthe helianthi]
MDPQDPDPKKSSGNQTNCGSGDTTTDQTGNPPQQASEGGSFNGFYPSQQPPTLAQVHHQPTVQPPQALPFQPHQDRYRNTTTDQTGIPPQQASEGGGFGGVFPSQQLPTPAQVHHQPTIQPPQALPFQFYQDRYRNTMTDQNGPPPQQAFEGGSFINNGYVPSQQPPTSALQYQQLTFQPPPQAFLFGPHQNGPWNTTTDQNGTLPPQAFDVGRFNDSFVPGQQAYTPAQVHHQALPFRPPPNEQVPAPQTPVEPHFPHNPQGGPIPTHPQIPNLQFYTPPLAPPQVPLPPGAPPPSSVYPLNLTPLFDFGDGPQQDEDYQTPMHGHTQVGPGVVNPDQAEPGRNGQPPVNNRNMAASNHQMQPHNYGGSDWQGNYNSTGGVPTSGPPSTPGIQAPTVPNAPDDPLDETEQEPPEGTFWRRSDGVYGPSVPGPSQPPGIVNQQLEGQQPGPSGVTGHNQPLVSPEQGIQQPWPGTPGSSQPFGHINQQSQPPWPGAPGPVQPLSNINQQPHQPWPGPIQPLAENPIANGGRPPQLNREEEIFQIRFARYLWDRYSVTTDAIMMAELLMHWYRQEGDLLPGSQNMAQEPGEEQQPEEEQQPGEEDQGNARTPPPPPPPPPPRPYPVDEQAPISEEEMQFYEYGPPPPPEDDYMFKGDDMFKNEDISEA